MGPGQRVAYVMLDVKRHGGDVRAFVAALEGWIIGTLADLGVTGETRQTASASGFGVPTRGPASRTRSPPSDCA